MSEQPTQPAGEYWLQLAGLDFDPECGLVHHDVPCTRPAVYSAMFHYCRRPEGILVLVCEPGLKALLEAEYPHRCPKCNHAFGSFVEKIWAINKLPGGHHE